MFSIRRYQEPNPGQSRTVAVLICMSPYAETWVVHKGEAEFTIGDQRAHGSSGDIVVGPANIPHRFKNFGNDRLEIICIHPCETFQQTFL